MTLTIVAMDFHWEKVYELALLLNKWERIEIAVHPSYVLEESDLSLDVKDYTKLYEETDLDDKQFVIASLCPQKRKSEYDKWEKRGASFATLIHPGAYIFSGAKIGNGCIVFAGGLVGPSSEICNNVVLEEYAGVPHDNHIGPNVVIMQKATIGGYTKIGGDCFLKYNSVIKEKTNIGEGVTVEYGAVVLKDIPDGQTVRGNPARAVMSA